MQKLDLGPILTRNKFAMTGHQTCYNPLYYDSPLSPERNNDDNSITEDDFVFTAEEEAKYRRRQGKGYDNDTDTRYNTSLSYDTLIIAQPVNLLKRTGTLAKVLDKQISHTKLPVLSNPSSSAKVITSEKNRKRLKEREEKIIAEIKRKELMKMERQRKCDEKNKEKKEQHQRKIEAQLKQIQEQQEKINKQKEKIMNRNYYYKVSN